MIDYDKLIAYLIGKKEDCQGDRRNVKIQDLIDGLQEQGLMCENGVIKELTVFRKGHKYMCLVSHTHAGCLYKKGTAYTATGDNELLIDGCHDFGKFNPLYFSEIPEETITPRFKKGDWAVLDGHVYEILNYHYSNMFKDNIYDYIDDRYEHGQARSSLFDDKASLWTVKDAKEGDFLVYVGPTKSSHGIFIKRNGMNTSMYCGITTDGHFVIDGAMNSDSDDIRPATRMERETLFDRIEKEGYVWNEKKLMLSKASVVKKEVDIEELVKVYRDNSPFQGDYSGYGEAFAHAYRQGLITMRDILS